MDLEVLGRDKRRAAAVSLVYNVALTVLKLGAALLTGSVALLSEAVHSATDVVASSIAFLSVRASMAPPDRDHPYGHGKIESLAGFAEAILLLLIVAYILFEAVRRLFVGSVVQNLDIGLAVMAFSSVTSVFVARYVSAVGKRTNSLALRSNGQHLMVDFWTSVGVLAALAVTRLTGWAQADSVFAIVFAVWIAFGASRLAIEAVHQLIDQRMPDEEIALIEEILARADGALSYHNLRTRHSGHVHYVDVHVVVPNDWSVVQAHDLADALEKEIERRLAPAHATIHIDPYDPAKTWNNSS
jgi:cation diffusion facilitator family transporter